MSARFWLAAVALAILLGFVLLPSLPTRFYSDDFSLLVESQPLPLAQAEDQLHRPLRNVTFKLAERALGLDHPLPYRIAVLAAYLLLLGTVGWLLGSIGVRQPWSVLLGVAFVAFYPRNHTALFWFAASQDVVVAWLAVLCCALFLLYRRRASPIAIAASALAYAIALGFKETAIVTPGLVLVADILATRPGISELRTWKFWRPYAIFVLVAGAYAAYFLMDRGSAALAGQRTGGYYNPGGPLIISRAFLRMIVNILLPFAHGFSLRQMTAFRAALLLAIAAAVAWGAYRARLVRFPAAGLAWILIAAAPVSVFAHFFLADHYLLLPVIGAAVAIAGMSQPVFENRKWAALAVLVLFAYCGFGAWQLIRYRTESRQAAEYFSNSVQSLLAVQPPLLSGADVYVIGLMHDWESYPVANNGLLGGLESHGFSNASKLEYNFAEDVGDQRALQAAILACPADSGVASAHARVLLVNSNGAPAVDRTGPCALSLIQTDQSRRPLAWIDSSKLIPPR